MLHKQERFPWRSVVVIVGVWVAIGLFTTQSSYLVLRRAGAEVDWMEIFVGNLTSVLLWAAFTPIMVWLARRVPFARRQILRPALIHAGICLGFAAADVVIEHWIVLAIPSIPSTSDDMVSVFLRRLFLNTLCYVAVVAIATVIDYARVSRDREARTVRLAAQLTEARMQALHAQLRPHFLFNTLSMIAEQVHIDAAGADRMIGRLSHLLRVSLSMSGSQEVTLTEEREALQAYLDIMRERFSGRVRVNVDFPPELDGIMLPSLILQPLAENAFHHGIEAVDARGEIWVSARRIGAYIEISIADNGKGLPSGELREGLGLRLVRERLQQMYGIEASLALNPRSGGGTVAIVRMLARAETVAHNAESVLASVA